LYKSISHPLTKKTKQKTYMNITIPSVKTEKYEKENKQKKLTTYKLKKSKSYCTQTRSKKNNTDYSKCTHGYEKCQINSALS